MSVSPRPDPLAFLTAELESLKQQGLYRTLRVLDGEAQAHATYDHRSVVNLSSNNYLGLTTHPKLRQARARRGARVRRRLGRGAHHRGHDGDARGARAPAGGVQADRGRGRLPERLRRQRRHGVGDPRPRTTSSSRTSSTTPASSTAARLSRAHDQGVPAQGRRRRARDPRRRCRRPRRKLLITDGVFSMDGDLGALPALCDLADEFGCIMMVDDAHASGVFGRHGRGTVDHFGCTAASTSRSARCRRRSARSAATSPARATSSTFLHHRARPFLFSTSHPPAVTAACLAALDVLETEPQLDRAALGQHALLQGGPRRARLQHRHAARARSRR